ncbi:MAG: 30S ribosomal protein S13 [Nitrososphaerales archaeon]
MSSEFRHIVRIAGKDLDGTKKVVAALADIKGIGQNLAHAILNALKIDSKLRLGSLSEAQISEIEQSLKDLRKIGIPTWAFNRRKDLETGGDFHIIGSDLELTVRSDIQREMSIGSWRGVRHSLGLKVRGQRTRTTGRKGATVGVKKPGKAPTQTKTS